MKKKVPLRINLGVFPSVFVPGEYVVVLLKGDIGKNRKTGGMPSVYYLRQDVSPCVPVVTKKSPICGSCPFQYEYKSKRKRGMPKCYVDRARSVLSIWRNYVTDGYVGYDNLGDKDIEAFRKYLVKTLGSGIVRIGAYGDPGCISPAAHAFVMGKLETLGFKEFIGYTHAWRTAPHLKSLLLASCFGSAETGNAADRGWNTFSVYEKCAQLPREAPTGLGTADFTVHKMIECRAAVNPNITCRVCRLCQVGKNRRFIAINAH